MYTERTPHKKSRRLRQLGPAQYPAHEGPRWIQQLTHKSSRLVAFMNSCHKLMKLHAFAIARFLPSLQLGLPAPWRLPLLGLLLCLSAPCAAVELDGVKVALAENQGATVVKVERLAKFKLRLEVERKDNAKSLALRVDLPSSGPHAWPAADVEVRDAEGKALLVQRSGIEWEKLLIPLPAALTTCVVQAVEPAGGWPPPTRERDQTLVDSAGGLQLRVARWPHGRKAALSIRFDDSHPTHLSKAIPLLDEYGFRGTFMINPGKNESGSRHRSDFQDHLAEWTAVAKTDRHELANHSAHHRGGFGDEDMEAEVAEAAQAIWQLTPGRSKLTALNLGGGTRWDTTRTLRYYLAKYHQFDASSGSLGMDDVYGGRVQAFREMLARHLERGLWCRVHYHYIGEGLSTSEANFRAALDLVKQHQSELWIAGMADIHKYQTERNAAKLSLLKADAHQLHFQLTCATDPLLYDQPLAMELFAPATWKQSKVVIKGAQSTITPSVDVNQDGVMLLRFQVAPRDAAYSIHADS